MDNFKKISILGSTGSIGTQTLDVIRQYRDNFEINFLTVNSKIDLLQEQIDEFNPYGVVITDTNSYNEFMSKTNFKGEVLTGFKSLNTAAEFTGNDLLINGLVGFSGVEPTYYALKAGIDVGLANKETLVSAGKIITDIAKDNKALILAIDSEHSAILQCLQGEKLNQVEKLILTASGGPFRNTPNEEFKNITVAQALKHPNWTMGSKITIDSATMMNKGLEVIEAHWLFGIESNKIEIVIHPQSIIHSLVEFKDTSIKAQLGLPDMRVPIAYTLFYPYHQLFDFPKLSLTQIGQLDFFEPDFEKFKCLKLAYQVLEKNDCSSTVLNAANEVGVAKFLSGEIRFDQIADIISYSLDTFKLSGNLNLNELINIDSETRERLKSWKS